MNVQFAVEQDGRSFYQVIDMDKKQRRNHPPLPVHRGDRFIFRLSRCRVGNIPCDDGSGNEASWWAVFVGDKMELVSILSKGESVLDTREAMEVLFLLQKEEDELSPKCWIHGIHKPRFPGTGRFLGADRQEWATAEAVRSILQRACDFSEEDSIKFV